jgi:hypothetical protein
MEVMVAAQSGTLLRALSTARSQPAPNPEILKEKHWGGLCLRKKLRAMDRDKQSSKRAFGAWSDPNKQTCGWLDGFTPLGYSGPDPG